MDSEQIIEKLKSNGLKTKNYNPKINFTEEGLKTLRNKLDAQIKCLHKTKTKDYPLNHMQFGFSVLQIKNQEEAVGRIKELIQILGIRANIIKRNFGNEIKWEVKI